MKNKGNSKSIYIIVIVCIIILFVFLYFKFTNVTFYLNGDNPQIIKYGSDYVEDGYYAANGFGSDISDNVSIDGNIDSFKEGTQTIEYTLKFGGVEKKITREVLVLDDPFKNYDFILNGESIIYLVKGESYQEEGAYVVKKDDNTLFENVEVDNQINVLIPNEYEVIYSFTLNDDTMTKKRKVIVLDNNEEINVNSDGKSAIIKIIFANIYDYTKTVLPDGKISTDKEIEFKVIANGEYHFIVYNNEKQVLDKKVIVDNLTSNLSCVGEVKVSGTFLNIISDTIGINKIIWNYDGEKVEGAKEIRINKRVQNASAEMEFVDGTKMNVNCSLKDNLAYTFKYDEGNTKPFMTCKTYTEQDRINLDAKLKKAVSDAGYGTRAGVVEAARFLVGALDYKVPYLGPKKINTALGRYNKVGLNIGNSGAWGCHVSGWTQGMDCTNFVKWAFAQNGLSISDYYNTSNTYKSTEVVGNLRVGDLMLSPCTVNCENKNFSHVGIVIGIDDKYIYIAESTTGTVNAIIVSKYDKFNMPKTKNKFSMAKLYKYPQDGNITNMWMN